MSYQNGSSTTLDKVQARLSLDIKSIDNNFTFQNVDHGTFNIGSADNIHKSLFLYANTIAKGQSRNGTVDLNFGEGIPSSTELTVSVEVTVNGTTIPPVVIDPPVGTSLSIALRIIQTAQSGFTLINNIYHAATPCFTLKVENYNDVSVDTKDPSKLAK